MACCKAFRVWLEYGAVVVATETFETWVDARAKGWHRTEGNALRELEQRVSGELEKLKLSADKIRNQLATIRQARERATGTTGEGES